MAPGAGARLEVVTLVLPTPGDGAMASAATQIGGRNVRKLCSAAELDRLASDGILKPRIDHVITLPGLPDAFDRYAARRLAGKIVVQGESA